MAEFGMEVELKYATDAATLDALAGASRLGPAELGEVVVNDEEDRYLDTPDGRLAAVLWAARLRSRRVGGVTTNRLSLKGPAASVDGAVHRRPEVEGPATATPDPAAWPPSAARDHLDLLRGGGALVTRLTLRQRRRERRVTLEGRDVGLLSLDEVEVVGADAHAGMTLVELERGVDARDEDFALVGRALAAVDGLVADGRSKLERAIAALGIPQVAR